MMDLSAMMAAQMEHVGFGCAWQLIEEVLYGNPPGCIEALSPLGQSLKLEDEAVWLAFEPFSLHARQHPGDAETRLQTYADKLHEFRQLQGLLAAHGIRVRVRLPQADTGHACSRQSDDFVIESVADGMPVRALLHEAPGLGALAFTLVDVMGTIIEHRYPLSASAISRFRKEAAECGWTIERLERVVLSADGLDLAAPDHQVRH
jgi:hypothetical protein